MAEKASALYSIFIIDGVQQEFTPAQLLDAVTAGANQAESNGPAAGTIVDETIDPALKVSEFTQDDVDVYLNKVLVSKKHAPLACAGSYTRGALDVSLIDAIWSGGHFRLGDFLVDAVWSWNEAPVGAMAAFYESAGAAADSIDALGLKFGRYRYSRNSGDSSVKFRPYISEADSDDDYLYVAEPFHTEHPTFSGHRFCPSSMQPDAQSWIIFIPFDSSDFRLGGSLLAQALGVGAGTSPQISDADYFIDCYEVVRELVEDGIVIAGATAGDGGLLKAVKEMSADGTGLDVDISDIMRSYHEKDAVRVLFSDIPGAVIQIRDSDFDYLDAELLLQDVAYFPLGHPVPGRADLHVKASAKSGIQTILESLMQNAEGED